jgi:hypothetical protein
VKESSEQGLRLARELGAKWQEASLRGRLGEMAFATGQADAVEHFAAMLAIAQLLEDPDLIARAQFGVAAATPFSPAAGPAVSEAKEGLRLLGNGLESGARDLYLAVSERRRVLEGNHIAFGSALTTRAIRPSSGPLGLFGAGGGAL